MQNVKDHFYYHRKSYKCILDFEKFFLKIVYDTLALEVSDNNLCLSIVNANKNLLLVQIID